MPWLLPLNELTPDQARAVELPINENRLICGLPGSGKTLVVLHRAAYLKKLCDASPDKYRIFLFTNVLRDFVRSGIAYLQLDEESVSTFDHWCRLFFEKHRPGARLPFTGTRPDFGAIRREVLELLTTRVELRRQLEFALVDEGQDLTEESYRILTLSAKHVSVFADFLQSLYSDGTGEEALRLQLGITQKNVTLLGAHRNSTGVARLASYFLEDASRGEQLIESARPAGAAMELPQLVYASSPNDELDALAEVVRQRCVLNERIGILVPQNRFVFGISKALEERGVYSEPAVPPRRGTVIPAADFDSDTPKIATYHSAKGLTFDVVLMPRLVLKAFGSFEQEKRLRMLFVGIARARQWVYLSSYGENRLPELLRLRNAESCGRLSVTTLSPNSAKPNEREESEVEEELDLL